jgi:hypothetical protein
MIGKTYYSVIGILVNIVTRLHSVQLRFNSKQRQGYLLFAITFGLSLGPTQPPIQWVLRAVAPGGKQAGASHMSSWCHA